jgi:hypothetical protein
MAEGNYLMFSREKILEKQEREADIHNEKKKMERNILISIGLFLMCTGIYCFGAMFYEEGRIFNYQKRYDELSDKKSKLVRSINELQIFVPMMKEPFATQYKDSLKNAVQDTIKINSEMAKIKAEELLLKK